MSKRSTYRSEQKDFEKYFGDDLSENERHALESSALEDGFEAEAMEGWAEVPVDVATADMADLRKRLAPAKKKFNWFKIAAAVALLVVASIVVLINFNQPPETLSQDKINKNDPVESSAKESTDEPSSVSKSPESDPAPLEVEPEAIEAFEPPSDNELIAFNDTNTPDTETTVQTRTTAPRLQAKSKVAEDLAVADVDISELEIVESEEEALVQVLAVEGQDQGAVRLRAESQAFSVASEDFFEVRSKDDWKFRQIQGNVLDDQGQIISDARVVLSGTSILAVSDFNGKFEMAIPDSLGTPTLVFSSSGFDQLSYEINVQDTFDVVMERDEVPAIGSASLSRQARKNATDVDLETIDESDFITALPEGGYKKFRKYLKKNTRTPSEARRTAINGTVLLSAQVSTSGELTDIKVIRGLGAGCDEEAIRVVKEGPSWLPAKSGDTDVESTVEIEVKFD